jgi:hypothetical protein
MSHSCVTPEIETRKMIVTVVHSAACHFCDDAQSVLDDLAQTYPLMIDLVDIRTGAGQELIGLHRPPMTPLVLVDGEFFSFGRLSRRKLVKLLKARLPAAEVATGTRGSQAC